MPDARVSNQMHQTTNTSNFKSYYRGSSSNVSHTFFFFFLLATETEPLQLSIRILAVGSGKIRTTQMAYNYGDKGWFLRFSNFP